MVCRLDVLNGTELFWGIEWKFPLDLAYMGVYKFIYELLVVRGSTIGVALFLPESWRRESLGLNPLVLK